MFDFSDPASLVNLIGLVVPLLVALLTNSRATQGLKSVLNFALSAVLGSAAYLVAADGGGYDVEGFVNAALTTFVVSITSYYGLYKKTGVAGSIADKTAKFGLGSPPTAQTDDVGEETNQRQLEPVSRETLDMDVSQLWSRIDELNNEIIRLDATKSDRRGLKRA